MNRTPLTSALVLLLLVSACKKPEDSPGSAPTPTGNDVTIAASQMGSIEVEQVAVHEVGTQMVTSAKITFDDAHVTHVFSPVTGRIVTINAQLGQVVKKGDALATIVSPDIGVATSDVGKANADLIAAEHDQKRKRDLYEAHAGSQADYETAQDNYGKALAELERAKQKATLLNSGDVVGQTYTLRSLIDGEVLMRNVNPGVEVQGEYGGGTAVELFTVGTLDPVWAMADVFEVDLARVQKGSTVKLKVITYPDKSFDGVVDWVADVIDPTTRTARVRCILPNPDHLLKPEMYATATIIAPGRKALALRRSAVVRLGDQDVVFVQTGKGPNGDTKFVRKPVQVDMDEPGDFVPLLGGPITTGDSVVVKNAILVSES